MKHLKLFQTEAEYSTFNGGEDFVLPNVSYTVDTAKVFYNLHTDGSSETNTKYININAYDINCSSSIGAYYLEAASWSSDDIFITEAPIKSLKLYPKTANSGWSDIVLIINNGFGEVLFIQNYFTWDSETETATATEGLINTLNDYISRGEYCTLAFMSKQEDLGTVFMDSVETVIEYTI